MRMWNRVGVMITLATLLVACDSGRSGGSQRTSPMGTEMQTPKRITLAVVTEPTALRTQLSRSSIGSLPGSQELEQLVHAGLAIMDVSGKLQPQLAEAVPTIENGGWAVFPDGRMEVTWKLRQGARWQDGTPLTSDDIIFTSTVARDRELLVFRNLAFDSVDSVEAPDATTVVVKWSKPWITADTLFAAYAAVPVLPLPKHLLETAYTEAKATIPDLSFWSDDFVGAGPYRLKAWARGSHLQLAASDVYVLGRPKVDEITVKFIRDRGTLTASLLGGDVELPLGNTLSLEEAVHLQEQWKDGSVEFSPTTTLKIWPQFRSPNPPVVGNVGFRRALLHSLDRQQMADSLGLGQSSVSDSTLSPLDPEYPQLQGSIVRYPYDPRLGAQLIAGLGYARGSDEMWRDASGQPLSIEVRTVPRDILIKSILSAADDWKRSGVNVDPIILTEQQRSDPAFYATYPAFDAAASNNGVEEFFAFHSSQAKVPENRYSGSNRSSYTNADLDSLIDRFFTAVPTGERTQVAGQIVHHVTDQVVFLPLFFDLSPTMVANRLANVSRRLPRSATPTWNAHLWDVQG